MSTDVSTNLKAADCYIAPKRPFTHRTSTCVKNAASCRIMSHVDARRRTSTHVDVRWRASTWGMMRHDAARCVENAAEINPVLISALCDARQRASTCAMW